MSVNTRENGKMVIGYINVTSVFKVSFLNLSGTKSLSLDIEAIVAVVRRNNPCELLISGAGRNGIKVEEIHTSVLFNRRFHIYFCIEKILYLRISSLSGFKSLGSDNVCTVWSFFGKEEFL